MAPDDRTFEKALAHDLRLAASGEVPAPQPECADAETLAAYHERLLAPDELNSRKEHIAGCSRCQEILAQLEATDEIPLGASGESPADSNVLVMQPAQAAPALRTDASLSARSTKMPAAAWVPPRRVSGATWRWAVPAGALAAGLLIWIVSRENHLQESVLHPSSQVEVAENRRTAATPQSAATDDVASQSAQSQSSSKSADTRQQNAPAAKIVGRVTQEPTQRAKERDFDQDQKASSAALAKAPSLPKAAMPQEGYRTRSDAGSGSGQQPLSALADDTKRPGDFKQQDVQGIAGGDKLDKAAGAAGGVIHPAAAPAAPAPGAYARRDSGKKERAESKDKAAAAAQTETVTVNSEPAAMLDTNTVSLVVSGGPRFLPVPGTQVIWKIDDDGRVRRSSDLGDTWQLQDVGVNATLLSGTAPSEKVCWLVGTFGTVLLTTDSGAHWARHTLPVSAPADRITAFDAQHAVVTLRASNTQFETFDGGQTWSLVKKK